MKKDPVSDLLYREWKAREVRAVLVLVHGLGAHSGRWNAFGEFFAKRGISSYALELKGFGETEHHKGYIDSFDTYLADIKRLTEIAKSENKDAKIFLLGESLGALIAIITAKENPSLFSGLACISPAFSSKLRLSIFDYARILAALIYNPKKHFVLPFNSAMCTRDENYRLSMDADKREHRLATPRFFILSLKAQLKSSSPKDWPKLPTLFLVAGKDKMVSTKAIKKVFGNLKVGDKVIIDYPEMYHSISVDLGKEKAFEDIFIWLEKRI